jgi:hypothetical protein
MPINLSPTTPAAPAGTTNITPAADGLGNISAHVPTFVDQTTESPTSAATAGRTAEVAWDDNNIYVCVDGGTAGNAIWLEAALSPTSTVATPVISPSTGTFDSVQTCTITCSTSGVTIYYTVDGSTPTPSSTLYTGSFSVSVSETVKAIAVRTGWATSSVATSVITLQPATPTFSPVGGTYVGTQSVTITSTGATSIYYTTDGSTPTTGSTLYSGPVSVSSSLPLKAIGVTTGWTNSSVGSANYVIGGGVAFVASTAATDNGSFAGTITTSAIDTSGANFLVTCVQSSGGTRTMSDSYGNTWQALGYSGNAAQLFYSYNPTVGTGHTFTATTSGGDISIAVAAFSGMLTTSSVYESGSNVYGSPIGGSQGPVQAGSITPATSGDLIINGLGWTKTSGSQGTVSIDSGFTLLDLTGIGNWSNAVLAYLITSSTSSEDPNWTLNSPSFANAALAATGAAFAQL